MAVWGWVWEGRLGCDCGDGNVLKLDNCCKGNLQVTFVTLKLQSNCFTGYINRKSRCLTRRKRGIGESSYIYENITTKPIIF